MIRLSSTSFLIGTILGYYLSTILFAHQHLFHEENNSSTARGSGGISEKHTTQTDGLTRTADKNDGWATIDVYVGIDHTQIPAGPQFHSQTKQDEVISNLFKGWKPEDGANEDDNGRRYFIDLAANDAIKISNTLALERDFGFDGLCIEPNPIYWYLLAHRRCKVVAAVIANEANKSVQFTSTRKEYGGIAGLRAVNSNNQRTDERRTTTFLDLLRRNDVPKIVHYFNLDVEGAEDLVMAAFPWEEYTFLASTMETPSKELKMTLYRQGYVYKYETHSELWLHRSFDEVQDVYPKGNLIPADEKAEADAMYEQMLLSQQQK